MKDKHIHKKSDVCTCSLLAMEPDEQCPIHGYPWPPRCAECGQYMKWQVDTLDKNNYNDTTRGE